MERAQAFIVVDDMNHRQSDDCRMAKNEPFGT